MITHSADIVIVGSGITAALMAASLAEKTTKSILVVEAGKPTTPFAERVLARDPEQLLGGAAEAAGLNDPHKYAHDLKSVHAKSV